MHSLGDRIRAKRRELNISQIELAKKVGITQGALSHLESGRNETSKELPQIALALGVDVHWLLTGQELKSNIRSSFEATDDWDSSTPLDDDEVEIPFYKDFSFACGHGSTLEAMQNETRRLRMSKATLNRIGSSKDMIIATVAEGDSMSPTINDGATIWVDTSKNIKDGHIFVFEYGGLFMCKRLYRLPNDGLKVVSDNEIDYPTFEITGEQREQNGFRLIGWVWHWSVMVRW